jgi:hypothetical protein
MGVYRDIVTYVNRNVFLSNFLLLPAMYYCLMGIRHIKKWDIEPSQSLTIYLWIWYFMLFLIIIVFCFSMLYHGTMYDRDSNILKIIARLDYLVTAPLMSIVLVVLWVTYIVFVRKRLKMNCPINDISVEVFGAASLYLVFTFFYYLIKKYRHKGYSTKDVLKKVIYLVGHTFFHYIGHTGITLLALVYLLDNRNIYETFFLKKC